MYTQCLLQTLVSHHKGSTGEKKPAGYKELSEPEFEKKYRGGYDELVRDIEEIMRVGPDKRRTISI